MTSTPAVVADARTAVADELTELTDLLEALPSASWDEPTLCAGWRVREVVAHLTMPGRYSMPRTLFELVRSRGDFNAMANRCARRDASQTTTAELVTALRSPKLQNRKPPGGGYQGALVHAVIHGLDVTVALGIDRQVPAGRMRLVLAGVVSPRSLKHFGTNLTGVELRATNLDWSYGSGATAQGTAQDLALLICGRTLPRGRLKADGSDPLNS
jgi:uncharacterized protein (TIGR03083 family)